MQEDVVTSLDVTRALAHVILRSPGEFGRRRISEILRFAQNDNQTLLNNPRARISMERIGRV